MGKYEIEMEITGFRLKVKGERDDMPMIAENLRSQLPRLIEPAINITQGNLPGNERHDEQHDNGIKPEKAKTARRSRRTTATNGEGKSTTLNWSHDPGRWGVPRQSWTAWQKILWILRVAKDECSMTELSGPSIAETFNKHFRQAGTLIKQSMPRDLGSLKQRAPALVSDDASKAPITWFLTEEGIKEADKLVSEAKASGTSSP